MEKIILFQGDSITDCGRKADFGRNLGHGYATLVGAALGAAEPYQYRIVNRGIGGNRIVDLYARMKVDMDNPVRIAEVKKDIARVMTIIREQQLAGR